MGEFCTIILNSKDQAMTSEDQRNIPISMNIKAFRQTGVFMNWTKFVKLIPITVTLLLMLSVAFILIRGFLGTYTAPSISVSDAGLADDWHADVSDVSEIPGSSGIASPSDMGGYPGTWPALPGEDAVVPVQMDRSDIYRGCLLLINNKNRYEIPDDNDLVSIAELKTSSYIVPDSDLMLSAAVIGPLNDMMDAFYNETGCDTVAIASAFRDYQRQREILDYYISIVGLLEAKKWAANPGHSEHHSGLAVDFGVFSNGALKTFLRTGVNEWLFRNSDMYGFIPRYPSDKSDITNTANEPWHFRYVGLPHSYFIRQSGLCFEEYLDLIMGFTRDRPYCATFDGDDYEVYYTRDTKILIPYNCEYDISGNNIDGFIVTVKRQENSVLQQQ